ncbi:manganese efflux pump MntP family protein [Methanobacterium alcaliphilum]|uniref:manganese efflux pump MntP n=1 Tax=Methanobacterium alcaliphilum TaxID=392018 RepID=UPI00200B9BD0|nr:manganese efflux pump MntP family protein [Methanobacterium alcaliphilum]MCK9151853.1 manganese efflux pump MntP family protein [Methanobacterium alcaliphilum]
MDFISIIFLAFGLAMDAFSVSITRGLSLKCNIKYALIIALSFGVFQALMPILGWFSGMHLQSIVSTLAPWIAFLLLLGIGLKMIYESFSTGGDDTCQIFSIRELLILSIATSIDAFAVGVTFAILNTSIITPIIIIGIITFILSLIGVYIGKNIGHLFENKIEILGGLILIAIGFKILLENIRF